MTGIWLSAPRNAESNKREPPDKSLPASYYKRNFIPRVTRQAY